MPKVKIVILSSHSYYDEYDSYSRNIILSGITDWEDISDEEYKFLLDHNGYHLEQAMKLPAGSSVLIIKQDEIPITNRIESITKLIKKMEADRIKEEQDRIAKKEAAALARRLKKEAKTEKDELALLAALKAKHEKE